jgi:hypothetical protein
MLTIEVMLDGSQHLHDRFLDAGVVVEWLVPFIDLPAERERGLS